MTELTWSTIGSTDWIADARGNRCSVRYFGSKEAAERALRSLIDCDKCTNCSRCSGCSGCSDCSRCSDCSDCSHVALLYGRKDLKGDPDAMTRLGQPPIPKIENIHRRIYEAASQPGALNMERWHCGTTHCRAGWVVHLAGEAGYALERYHNTALADQLIYRESGAPINPCRFYDCNEDALADMQARAEAS